MNSQLIRLLRIAIRTWGDPKLHRHGLSPCADLTWEQCLLPSWDGKTKQLWINAPNGSTKIIQDPQDTENTL